MKAIKSKNRNTMSVNKSFHLRWNNHLSNLQTLLEFLYNEQSFVDVTLSCSDGMLRAHKLVLSACSPYFDSVFRENPCKHPTVILKGVSLREMQLIIEYMYVGSVDVPESELSSLLQIAGELHIKGLVQSKAQNNTDSATEGSENNSFNNSQSVTSENQFVPIIKTDNEDENSRFFADGNNYESKKSNELNEVDNSRYNHTNGDILDGTVNDAMEVAQVRMDDGDSVTNSGENSDGYTRVRNHQNNVLRSNESDKDIVCKICNRVFINKQNMKRHMQTHSGEKPHRCVICGLSFLRLSHLQRHHRVHTGERPFACNQCDKQFSRSDKLKQHVVLHHTEYVPMKQLKQRGRPRKMHLTDMQVSDIQQKLLMNSKLGNNAAENYEENPENSVSAFHCLEQVYNISNTMNKIST